MSGLEALAALGLACNVFQVLSFAREVCVISRAICEKGETSDSTASLTNSLSNLAAIINEIESSTNSTSQPLSLSDKRMLDIAQDCSKAALKLKSEIDKVSGATASAKGRRFKAMLAAAQSLVSPRAKLVERLEKRLQTHQNVLETQLLVKICSKTDAAKFCQENGVNNLDATLREFVKRFSDGETRMSSLLIQQSDVLKAHITKETASLTVAMNDLSVESKKAAKELDNTMVHFNLSANDEKRRESLLKSLKYPTMNDRRNRIVDPHAETFGWIFTGPPSDDAKSVDHLAEYYFERDSSLLEEVSVQFLGWLRDPAQTLIWITGKPGSGKSTFIKFLADDPRTRTGLASSNHGAVESVILSHFIWSAGQATESSIKGMLSSLIWQLLHKDTALSDSVLEEFPETRDKDSFSDWSEKELRPVLRFLLGNPNKTLCLFIDGLDEINNTDGQMKLVEIIEEIRGASNVKLCLSSRPEPILQKHFGSFSMFRMQDLTGADIFRFTSSILREQISRKGINLSTTEHRELVRKVCFMAEGVFLWVVLGVRNLLMGLAKGDGMNELQQRLDMMPPELQNLYKVMWDRWGAEKLIYQTDAARYFNLIATFEDLKIRFVAFTPLILLLATDEKLSDRIILARSQLLPTEDELRILSHEMGHRVEVRCLGLLDVKTWDAFRGEMPIRFIHRSAKEFLETDAEGQALLKLDTSTKGERNFTVLKALIAYCFLRLSVLGGPRYIFRPLVDEKLFPIVVAALESHHLLESEALQLCMLSRPLFYPYHGLTLKGSTKQAISFPNRKKDFLIQAVREGFWSLVKQAVATTSCWGVELGAFTAPYLSHLVNIALGDTGFATKHPREKVETVLWLLEYGIQPNLLSRGTFNFENTRGFSQVELYPNSDSWCIPMTPFKAVLNCLIGSDFLMVNAAPLLETLTTLAKAGGDLSSTLLLATHAFSPTSVARPQLHILTHGPENEVYIEVTTALVIDLLLRKYIRHGIADPARVQELLAILESFSTPELPVRKVTIDGHFAKDGHRYSGGLSNPIDPRPELNWSTDEPGLLLRVDAGRGISESGSRIGMSLKGSQQF